MYVVTKNNSKRSYIPSQKNLFILLTLWGAFWDAFKQYWEPKYLSAKLISMKIIYINKFIMIIRNITLVKHVQTFGWRCTLKHGLLYILNDDSIYLAI